MSSIYLFPMLLILLLSPTYMARPQNVNIAQSGNTRISTIDGVFKCDEMICPRNSVKCTVSRKSTEDLLNIATVRTCFDYDGVSTKQENSTEPNPHPGTQISDYSEASRTGSHVVQHFNYGGGDSFVGANVDEINIQVQDWQERFQQQMNAFNANLHNDILQNIQNTLKNTIPKYRNQWN